MLGDFGKQLVQNYVRKLTDLPSGPLGPELRTEYFILCLLQIGESWRRFTHRHQGFPYQLWRLCDMEARDLCQQFGKFQEQAVLCPKCVDCEFTRILLSQVPYPIDPENPDHLQRLQKVQRLLEDLATFAPISTDSVEALHGFSQSKLGRVRGCKPTDSVAREICLWAKVCSAWKVLMTWVWDRTGDVQASRRVAGFFRKSSNQFSKESPADSSGQHSKEFQSRKMTFSKLRTLAMGDHAAKFKQKRLCGHFSVPREGGVNILHK